MGNKNINSVSIREIYFSFRGEILFMNCLNPETQLGRRAGYLL